MKVEKRDEIFQEVYSSDEEDLEIEKLQLELLKYIYQEIELLPKKMQEVFLLSFRDGLKPASIAERLQLSVQTVRNQKATALKRLRKVLGDKKPLLSALLKVITFP